MKALTAKVQRFVEEYLVDHNGAQAAIRAGYARKNAKVRASRLLARVDVRAAVKERRQAVSRKTGLTVEALDQRLVALNSFNSKALYDENGRFRGIHELDDDVAVALTGLESEELFEGQGKDREHIGTLQKVKFVDPLKALDLGYKRLGVLREPTHMQVAHLTVIVHD